MFTYQLIRQLCRLKPIQKYKVKMTCVCCVVEPSPKTHRSKCNEIHDISKQVPSVFLLDYIDLWMTLTTKTGTTPVYNVLSSTISSMCLTLSLIHTPLGAKRMKDFSFSVSPLPSPHEQLLCIYVEMLTVQLPGKVCQNSF